MANGGIVGPINTPSSTGASGVWRAEEVFDSSKNGKWPKLVTSGLVMAVDPWLTNSYPGSGTSWYDLSSTGNTYTSANLPTFAAGPPASFTFNGSSNLFIAPEASALNTNTPSVEVWVKTANTNQNGFWFEKGQVNTQYSLFQESTNIVWRTYIGASYTNLTVAATTYLSTTVWKHVVATYDGANKYIYINGVQVGSIAQTGSVATNANGSSIGVYGGYNGSRGYYYNGSLAELRVYNKALSAAEVLLNFNSTRSRYGV